MAVQASVRKTPFVIILLDCSAITRVNRPQQARTEQSRGRVGLGNGQISQTPAGSSAILEDSAPCANLPDGGRISSSPRPCVLFRRPDGSGRGRWGSPSAIAIAVRTLPWGNRDI